MTLRLTFACTFALILLTCQPNSSQLSPGLLSIEESRHLVKNYDPTIIDVRTPAEVKQGAIAGALFIDINSSEFVEQISKLDTAESYLVYCKKGARSAKARNIMNGMGFKKVYDMEGGYQKWLTTK